MRKLSKNDRFDKRGGMVAVKENVQDQGMKKGLALRCKPFVLLPVTMMQGRPSEGFPI
ncbi:hypothetical protein [Herbaspirillum sp. NPDC101397]|uniref:hypothetical protein n=1 Tax=Herbaspirillum sp. NPDC101397 TaxID=3364006 RepID=UPI00383B148B